MGLTLTAPRLPPFSQVWDSSSPSAPRLTLTSPSASGMSTLLENLNLQRSLLRLHSELAPRLPHSTVRSGVKVDSIDLVNGPSDYPTLSLSNGEQLRTRLLIGADGPRSPVRAFAGIGSTGHSYQTKTIVSCLKHTPYAPYPHGQRRTAYQRFLPTGPLAFLPMGETQGSLAWHLRDWETSDAVRTLPEESLVLLINACFRLPDHAIQHLLARVVARYRASPPGAPATEAKPAGAALLFPEPALDHAELASTIELLERSLSILPHSALSATTPPSHLGVPPKDAHLVPPPILALQPGTTASFPLFYSHAERYIAPRVALVGDAAHTVHPHAGMGLNMGLHDGRILLRAIEKAVEVGGDLGSEGSLKAYERDAWTRNQAVLTSTDSLERLYRWDNPVVKWVRGTGVEVIQELPFVKDMLIRRACWPPSSRAPLAVARVADTHARLALQSPAARRFPSCARRRRQRRWPTALRRRPTSRTASRAWRRGSAGSSAAACGALSRARLTAS